MDRIAKVLAKMTQEERERIKRILFRLLQGEVRDFDIQKLKGAEGIYRLRKGNMRIIYRRVGSKIFILAIERRSEKTYRRFSR